MCRQASWQTSCMRWPCNVLFLPASCLPVWQPPSQKFDATAPKTRYREPSDAQRAQPSLWQRCALSTLEGPVWHLIPALCTAESLSRTGISGSAAWPRGPPWASRWLWQRQWMQCCMRIRRCKEGKVRAHSGMTWRFAQAGPLAILCSQRTACTFPGDPSAARATSVTPDCGACNTHVGIHLPQGVAQTGRMCTGRCQALAPCPGAATRSCRGRLGRPSSWDRPRLGPTNCASMQKAWQTCLGVASCGPSTSCSSSSSRSNSCMQGM